MRELDRVAGGHWRSWCQRLLESVGVGHAGGLQHCRLGCKALQLGVYKLQAGELGFSVCRECVEVVVLVVDFDGGHSGLINEIEGKCRGD